MILRQYLHTEPVIAASYLFGCGGKGRGAVVDPVDDPEIYLEVLPGAFSGSVCGRGLSGKPSSTIGFERRFNRAFSVTDEQAFVSLMLEEIPPRPARAKEIRAENLGKPVTQQV